MHSATIMEKLNSIERKLSAPKCRVNTGTHTITIHELLILTELAQNLLTEEQKSLIIKREIEICNEMHGSHEEVVDNLVNFIKSTIDFCV